MNVAILASSESFPWVPIIHGFMVGMRELGHVVHPVPISGLHWLYEQELIALEPTLDLLLILVPRGGARTLRKYYLGVLDRFHKHGVPIVGLMFDDPYDMETGLTLAPNCDFVCTPEPLAVDVYERLGHRAGQLAPTVSTAMHYPSIAPVDPQYSVFWFGGTHWTPRKRIIPVLRDWCKANGHVWGEVAGRTRVLAASALTAELWRAKCTLEIARFSAATRSNPYQVPCTWTGPRLHIAAACGTPALRIVEGKGDGVYGSVPLIEEADAVEALAAFLQDDNARRVVAGDMQREFQLSHTPRTRCEQLLEMLSARGVLADA